ncbi:hypothetical protein HHI36_015669 [Cryptolaemus montrouzieri]|uniref:Uncharacterized protein n=1 Tax=Cryptolaemus montrouzieri TaxID=559131 RepID=A0ABD2N695_9CUCU
MQEIHRKINEAFDLCHHHSVNNGSRFRTNAEWISCISKVTRRILASELIKNHELPLKKQKLEEYSHLLPYNMQIQQIYASLEPFYNPYVPDLANVNRHISAFKPVPPISESKIKKVGLYVDPPILQHPEKVVPLSESERFSGSFQPNVALAPPTPKKHLYGKTSIAINEAIKCDLKHRALLANGHVVKREVEEVIRNNVAKSEPTLPKENNSTNRYNYEIELSTDTEDSASESSEKQSDPLKSIEDLLRSPDATSRNKIIQMFSTLMKERDKLAEQCKEKDEKIAQLEEKRRRKQEESKEAIPPIQEKGAVEAETLKIERIDEEMDIKVEDADADDAADKEVEELAQTQTSVIMSAENSEKTILKNVPE